VSSSWRASFISAGTPSDAGDPAVYFRRELGVGEGVRRATLHVTGLGVVEPYVNGVRVGPDVLLPGRTSYRHRLDVRSYDVTDVITAGVNALGAIVGEGWAVGRLGWEHQRAHYADRPALWLQLDLEDDDRTETVGTDSGFRVGTGAVRANGLYDGETYDARLEPDGWHRAGFDDSGWAPARPFAWDPAVLRAPVGPPIRRIEELAPAGIRTSPSGRTIVDFGQNISGWVRITVQGTAGDTVVLRHAELLTPAGELETGRTARPRRPTGTSCAAATRRSGSRGSPSTASATSRSTAGRGADGGRRPSRGRAQRHDPDRLFRMLRRPRQPAARQHRVVDAGQLRRCADRLPAA
jgi:alpha-L-rhamnosidase